MLTKVANVSKSLQTRRLFWERRKNLSKQSPGILSATANYQEGASRSLWCKTLGQVKAPTLRPRAEYRVVSSRCYYYLGTAQNKEYIVDECLQLLMS